MRVLLVTPPMIQLNTPYPATAYLTGFLRLHAADLGLEVTQADASLALFLRLFSAPLVDAHGRGAAPARAHGAEARRRCRRRSRTSSRTRALRRHGGAGDPLPAAPRPEPGVAHRRARRSFPKARASRNSHAATSDDPLARRSAASARPSRRAISRASTSTTSPTSGATASIRASSSRATASGSPRARRRSIRCTRRSTASRRSSTKRSTSSRASSSPRTSPTSSP